MINRVKKVSIEPELLESLYLGNEYSIRDIADIFSCGSSTILRRLRDCCIQRRKGRVLTDFSFNDVQLQMFEGCMLGDGHLGMQVNYCYFSNRDKHEDYLLWLQRKLGIKNISIVYPIYNFIGAKSPCGYELQTRVMPSIISEYERWYPDGKGTIDNYHCKIVPDDVDLTLIKVLFWYIGDGYYHTYDKTAYFTNCLYSDKADMLIEKLKVLTGCGRVTKHKNYVDLSGIQRYMIYFNRESTETLFKLFESLNFDVPDCYKYKFGG